MEAPTPLIHVHEDTVRRVNESIPCEEELFDLAELFKVFGDSCLCSSSRKCACVVWPSCWA